MVVLLRLTSLYILTKIGSMELHAADLGPHESHRDAL